MFGFCFGGSFFYCLILSYINKEKEKLFFRIFRGKRYDKCLKIFIEKVIELIVSIILIFEIKRKSYVL